MTRATSRISAVLATGALVLSSLLFSAFPSSADDAPTPSPTPDIVQTPAADPTSQPTDASTPDPESSPVETPSPEPTPPVPVGSTVSFTGTVNGFAQDYATQTPDNVRLLTVGTLGYLRVDVSRLARVPSARSTFVIRVPAGLILPTDAARRFAVLADYSATTAPLIITGTTTGGHSLGTGQSIIQNPNSGAQHHIYAVLVSPNSLAKSANQTAASAAIAVDYADDYWGDQSGGTIGFTLDGTVPWYKSTYSCKTDAGSTALWNQALAKARAAGFAPGKNNHLVLFFPSNASCAGAVGLGTIGFGVNDGGAVWVIGTDSASSKAILAHELGHNLSLGHADWLECDEANPYWVYPHFSDCEVNYYGDLVDVMGYAQGGKTAGALSSPQAIRAGIWDSSAHWDAEAGTHDYVINAVASHSGKRAVVVQGDWDNYFVELRDFSNEDSQWASDTCEASDSGTDGGGACVASSAGQVGVRILRLGMESDGYDQVYPGYDTYLVGRNGGQDVRFTAGDDYWVGGSGHDAHIQVVSISGGQATIRVTRTSVPPIQDFVDIIPSQAYGSGYDVGDIWTVDRGDSWNSDSYTYQWMRDNVSIPGATDSSYTLTAEDVGHYIRVSMTGTTSGYAPRTASSPDFGQGGYGPIRKGTYQASDPGTVNVDNSTGALVATIASFPDDSSATAYQWYHGTTAIAGATHATYNLVAADYNQLIKVRATVVVPGYSPTQRFSTAKNYSVTFDSGTQATITQASPVAVGTTLAITDNLTAHSTQGSVTATRAYQWLRNGAAIPGATGATYDTGSADYGKIITARLLPVAVGWIGGGPFTTPAVSVSVKGTFGPGDNPEVTQNGLTLSIPTDFLTTPMSKDRTYQWYRDDVAIPKATTNRYTLTAADWNKTVTVRWSVRAVGYDPILPFPALDNDAQGKYSIVPADVMTLTGTPTIGNSLTVHPGDYANATTGSLYPAEVRYQWYRSGVLVPSVTGDTYLVGNADRGKVVSIKVTASDPGTPDTKLPSIRTLATPVIGASLIADDGSPKTTVSPASGSTAAKTTLTSLTVGITESGATKAFQWFRDGVAISKATAQNYVLTAADRDHALSVRVTVSKKATTTNSWTSTILWSTAHDWSMNGTPVSITASPSLSVGSTVNVSPSYLDTDLNVVTGVTFLRYQWYRSGVAITGATHATYLLAAADQGKKITVKITAGKPGLISYTGLYTTNPSNLPVAAGEFPADLWADAYVQFGGGITLSAAVVQGGAGTVWLPTYTYTATYQWYRRDASTPSAPWVKISGATHQYYELDEVADYNREVSVIVTVSKPGFTTFTQPLSDIRAGENRTILTITPGHLDSPNPVLQQGVTAMFPQLEYAYDHSPYSINAMNCSWQWYRGAAKIAGSNNQIYFPVSADVGKILSVQVECGQQYLLPAWKLTASSPVAAAP